MELTTIDIVILVVLAAGAVVGFAKGFVRQLASVLGLVVGLIAAKTLYLSLAVHLCPAVTESITLAQGIAFVAIRLAVPLLFSCVASLITKALEAVSLGWINRWLGSGLAVLKYLLFISLLIGVLEFVDHDHKIIHQTKKRESLLYYPIESFAGTLFPAAEHMAQQYILENQDATRRKE